MTDLPSEPQKSVIFRMAPGYFSCKRRIKALHRYQNLIRHREAWAHQMQFACPIEELIPANSKPELRSMLIEREISRLMSPVHYILNDVGIATIISYRPRLTEKPLVNYDMIFNYFDLPPSSRQDSFERIMRALDRGIGDYESCKRASLRNVYNPIHWMAVLIRLPVTLIERAGLLAHEKMRDQVVGWYGKILQVLMALVLILVSLLLGMKLPWKDMLTRLIQLLIRP